MRRFLVMAVVATALFSMGLGGAWVEAKDSSKVGYIDLSKIFDEYTKTQTSSQALEKEGQAKQAEEQKRLDDIRRLKDELELLSKAAREKKQAKLDQKIKELQDFRRESREELLGETRQMMREIMMDIEAAIEEYGKSNNYDLILNDSKILPYSNRAVLYRSKGQDLTEDILKILNTKYKRR